MSDLIFDLLLYIGKLLALTLGTVVICGFAVHLCARLFARLLGHGSGTLFDVTSLIGTPVHELGHAAMCLIFGHKIQRIKLFSLRAENGVYGFVEHSYNRKNLWARLGNLFIAVGPIFSGLGVTVLTLWLCFPSQWAAYLNSSRVLLLTTETVLSDILAEVFSLIVSLPVAFGENWLRALLGLIVILPISLHITLSWQDIKSGLSAIPMYLFMVVVFALATYFTGIGAAIVSALWLLNLRTLSLFCIVIAFSVIWVLIALLIRAVRSITNWF